MPRDRAFEARWLARATAEVHPEFAPRVSERLEAASAELGEDSFRARTLRELVDEVAEEALDVAGWGVLAVQLAADGAGCVYSTARAVRALEIAAELAAHIDLLMRTAAELLPPPP